MKKVVKKKNPPTKEKEDKELASVGITKEEWQNRCTRVRKKLKEWREDEVSHKDQVETGKILEKYLEETRG